VLLVTVLRKSLVGRDEHASLCLSQIPQFLITDTLTRRPTDVQYIVSSGPEGGDGDIRNVFVDQNLHLATTASSSGVICSSAREAA
jgi:hypothetical protein